MEEQVKKIIEENALALATVNKKGNPHVIAVGDVKVVDENQILIGDSYMKETVQNFKENNNVALVVWKEEGYELRGTAEYFTEGIWLKMVKKIHQKYPIKGAILVTINKIKKLA